VETSTISASYILTERGGVILADIVKTVNEPNALRAFQALARIIGEKEGVEITLKSLKKKDEGAKPGTG
jgi:hypothetical protein